MHRIDFSVRSACTGPRMAFRHATRALRLELCTTDGKINHIQDGIDPSLRIKPQLEEGIVARKIASVPFVVCASPAYLERAGLASRAARKT